MNRFRAYRDIEGLSQQDLSVVLGVSPTMVSFIESGTRPYNGDVETAIGYRPERLPLPDMSAPLHRHRASTGAPAKKRAHELVRLGGEVFAQLAARTPKAPPLALERQAIPSSDEGVEDLAVDVRCLLGQDEAGPIQNLTKLVERAGVCLIPIVALAGIDGLSSWVDGTPVIGLAPAVPGDRFRLTLAHELAHLLIHREKSEISENQANRFAAALLFPQADFEAAMPQRPVLRDFANLKSTWGVSVAALVYRAHELGIIDSSRYRALQIQMSKWRRSEPGTFPPVHGQLFGRLVDVNGGGGALAQDLGVNARHLRELVDWTHLRAA